ncbi:molybdenum cofactor guanylyltransferase [Candidatus Poribacteria bacterium]|nr:molybdenum cofactor guanylyltransferase [Candidatus Poribacteria bacterium]
MHKNNQMVTGVILAGGKSKRMGENKAFLHLGENTIIGHIIGCLQPIVDELLLITNSPDEYAHLNIRMYSDIVANTGALGGIHTGLTHASHDTVVCVGCDSPFLNSDLLKHLLSVLGEYDAVIPYTTDLPDYKKINKKKDMSIIYQTLCAAYSKKCLPIIEEMFDESDYRVHALRERINSLILSPKEWQPCDPEGLSFININTPEDYIRAKEMYNNDISLG